MTTIQILRDTPLVPASPPSPSTELDAAVDLFWERGYVATSMSDLLARMRVSRKRVYAEYGSKEALFLAVLRSYVQKRFLPRVRDLRSGPQGLASVERFLRSWSPRPGYRGCLLCNSAAESENLCTEAHEVVRDAHGQLEAALRDNLLAAQARGEIDAHADPTALARSVLACYQGLAILGKVNDSPEAGRQVIETQLAGLRAPAPHGAPARANES